MLDCKQKMKKGLCSIWAVLLLLFVGCGSREADQAAPALHLFCAASLAEVAADLGEVFEEQTGHPVQLNTASSGVLARQILASRGADIFMSANAEWMQRVAEAGRLDSEPARRVASNRLVLVVRQDSPLQFATPCELVEREDFRFLAMGDPAHVPAGMYGKAWLESQRCGEQSLWERLQGQLSPAADVRAALTQLKAGPDVMALVYATDARVRGDGLRIVWEVPEADSPDISYWAGQLTDAGSPEAATAWMNFLETEPAREVFSKHGFLVPEAGK